MENIAVLNRSGFLTERVNRMKKSDFSDTSVMSKKLTPVIDKLVAEEGETFFNYLDWLGLSNDPNMLILSSKLHYYYDYEDFKGVTTLLNLKKLNLIKHLDVFLKNVYNILPPKTNFIGYFSDHKTRGGIGKVARMYKKVINFLDSRIETDLSKDDIISLFKSHGFEIIDMTDINGLTYFRTRNC
jgi:hypothetical protein